MSNTYFFSSHWVYFPPLYGQFYTDESALKEAGVTDSEQYAVEPGMPLQQDFYLWFWLIILAAVTPIRFE